MSEFYEKKLIHHGHSIKAVGWDDERRANARYEEVASSIRAHDIKDVLDYGCGLCHLEPFLEGIEMYKGYDKYKSYIDLVKSKNPGMMVTSNHPTKHIQAVVMVGTLSLSENMTDKEFMFMVHCVLADINCYQSPDYLVMTLLWKDYCNKFDPKLHYFDRADLDKMSDWLGMKVVEERIILRREKIVVMKRKTTE